MLQKYYKRGVKYLSVHPSYNAWVHILAGIGFGFLLTYPLAGNHPVRWAVVFLVLSALGHLYAMR